MGEIRPSNLLFYANKNNLTKDSKGLYQIDETWFKKVKNSIIYYTHVSNQIHILTLWYYIYTKMGTHRLL